ncbi:MAG: carbohydrate porin [Proteobacteria bacterium]|nr:carbohydrate porin [Pseudomonadota bacterium]
MRTPFLSAAVLATLAIGPTDALAATRHAKPAHRAAAADQAMQAELAARDRQIAALQAAVTELQSQVASLQQRSAAQAEVAAQTTQSVQSLQEGAKKTDTLEKIVNDTSVGGRVFIDMSGISASRNGVKTNASGYGLDIKRGYLTVSHKFNDIWSASLTTDFNYSAATGATNLFIKNLYLQGKFSDAFSFRAGEIPMAWTPYVENYYGYRYVENTLTDKQKVANTADWGLGANGQFGDGRFDYAAVLVNGNGFRNPTRSRGMDFEGHLGFTPFAGAVVAVGGYSGHRGLDTQTTNAVHTASRSDVMVAWARGNNRIGAEYYSASNWNNVLTPLRDRASGYSLWGSWGFAPAWSVFARYDRVDPSKDLDPSLRDRYYNVGAQWDVRKGVKLALVYKDDDLRDALNVQKMREFGIFGDISF